MKRLERCALALIFLLGGCSRAPVTVKSEAMKVERVNFEDLSAADKKKRDPIYEAYTAWFFHCLVYLHTDTVERDDTVNASTVRLKVKSLEIDLSCPVKIYLAKGASGATVDHENGHVELCRRVYALAPAAAHKAAALALGKTYYGMGANPEEARENALAAARGEVGEAFRQTVSSPCQDASETYDQLTARNWGDKTATPQVLVERVWKDLHLAPENY